jgi:hypothetical protein
VLCCASLESFPFLIRLRFVLEIEICLSCLRAYFSLSWGLDFVQRCVFTIFLFLPVLETESSSAVCVQHFSFFLSGFTFTIACERAIEQVLCLSPFQ